MQNSGFQEFWFGFDASAIENCSNRPNEKNCRIDGFSDISFMVYWDYAEIT